MRLATLGGRLRVNLRTTMPGIQSSRTDRREVRMRRKAKSTVLGALLGLLVIAALLGGCSKKLEPFRDAPRAATNTSPADVITMPDGFSNVAAKCDGPNRVYVVFHGDSAYGTVAVAPNDPRCSR
jgi:hypothetical protein